LERFERAMIFLVVGFVRSVQSRVLCLDAPAQPMIVTGFVTEMGIAFAQGDGAQATVDLGRDKVKFDRQVAPRRSRWRDLEDTVQPRKPKEK
jgi:hypothetical protein